MNRDSEHLACRFDTFCNTYLCVDEALRRRLEIKLISGLLAFKAA